MDLQGLLDCKINGFPVSEYLGFLEREVRRVDIKRIEMSWLLYSDGFYMGPLDRILKRGLDLTASTAGLLVLGPLLLAAALAIKLEDGGPALYRQTRVTLQGRSAPCASTPNVAAPSGPRPRTSASPASAPFYAAPGLMSYRNSSTCSAVR